MIGHFGKETKSASHHGRGVTAQRRDSDECPPVAVITTPPPEETFVSDTLYFKISKPSRLNGLKSISQ